MATFDLRAGFSLSCEPGDTHPGDTRLTSSPVLRNAAASLVNSAQQRVRRRRHDSQASDTQPGDARHETYRLAMT